jgi:hypothetical protein
MPSESARVTTAEEQRFRINDPNSKPRAVKVIALDRPSERVVERLARASWNQASFLTASAFASALRQDPGDKPFSIKGWLHDLAGRTKDLVDEINTADLVVMIADAGEDAHAASIIGEACSLRRVTTTALIMGTASVSDEALSRTLAQLRPWALMLVIANTDEYIDDMLTALRA